MVSVGVEFRCRVNSIQGFDAVDAAAQKARRGGHCPLERYGGTVEIEEFNVLDAQSAAVAKYGEPCQICGLNPNPDDFTVS